MQQKICRNTFNIRYVTNDNMTYNAKIAFLCIHIKVLLDVNYRWPDGGAIASKTIRQSCYSFGKDNEAITRSASPRSLGSLRIG